MPFQTGDRVAIVGKIIHLYHMDRDAEWQSAQVQLSDGQGVMTNLRNLVGYEPPAAVPAPDETLPADAQTLLDEALALDAADSAPEGPESAPADENVETHAEEPSDAPEAAPAAPAAPVAPNPARPKRPKRPSRSSGSAKSPVA